MFKHNRYSIVGYSMDNIESYYQNTASVSAPILIGTSQTMYSHTDMYENPVGGRVICSSSAENEFTFSVTAGKNPRSGCAYPLLNAFQNTTAFQQDRLENSQYYSVSSELDKFLKVLSVSNISLSTDQLGVAYAAYNLWELGYRICVMVSHSEIGLINFCTSQHLKCSIID